MFFSTDDNHRPLRKKDPGMDETLPSETTPDMIAIPETPSEGLLVSMALRADHGFLTPPHTALGMRLGLTDAERLERALRKALASHPGHEPYGA